MKGYYNAALFIVAERLKQHEKRNGALLTQNEVDERGVDFLRQFQKDNKADVLVPGTNGTQIKGKPQNSK